MSTAPIGSIICYENVFYYVSHYSNDEIVFDMDDEIVFDMEEENYMCVKTVILYKGKYWFIPSSVSFTGTLSTKRKFLIIHPKYPTPQILDRKICMEICPGWLD